MWLWSCIHIGQGKIAITEVGERNKGVIFKNCAPFTNCKIEINNTEIDKDKMSKILIQ